VLRIQAQKSENAEICPSSNSNNMLHQPTETQLSGRFHNQIFFALSGKAAVELTIKEKIVLCQTKENCAHFSLEKFRCYNVPEVYFLKSKDLLQKIKRSKRILKDIYKNLRSSCASNTSNTLPIVGVLNSLRQKKLKNRLSLANQINNYQIYKL
jgi:hypothetical protein